MSLRRRILVVHVALLFWGAGLLLAAAVPLYWEGLQAADPGALAWTVPSALVIGAVGGALEALLLRVWRPAGWVAVALACLLGLYVPGIFATSFQWAPAGQQAGASSGLATAWLGWAMFMVVLSVTVLGVTTLRRPAGTSGMQS